MRFAIMEVSVLLRSDLITGTAMKSRLQQRLHSEIMQLVEVVCTDPVINTTDFAASGQDVVGPAVYLLKLLVRQYGFPILRQVSEQHPWIVPEGLHNTDQVVADTTYMYQLCSHCICCLMQRRLVLISGLTCYIIQGASLSKHKLVCMCAGVAYPCPLYWSLSL